MRTRLAFLFIILGILLLSGQAWLQAEQERKFFELNLIRQRESIAKGLEGKWNETLLKLAREGRLEKTYVLNWNRTGRRLETPFFPMTKSSLSWNEFRDSVQAKDDQKVRNFLELALKRNYSWDRVLAINEWKNRFGDLPIWVKLVGYETTLVSPEAHAAFSRIFQLFEMERDFTFSTSQVDFDQVFFRVDEKGEIEAFVPSVEFVKRHVLPEFLKANGLFQANIGATPWEIRFDVVSEMRRENSMISIGLSILAIVLVSLGTGLYWKNLREEQVLIAKRMTFLNQVVHELKTPLAGLKLHTQIIKKAGATFESLEAIDQTVGRIDRLFDDIVAINRPSGKRIELEIISKDWLNSWLHAWKNHHDGKVEVSGSFTQDICSDKKRIDLILRNLVSNAVKYGVSAIVEVKEIDGETMISVTDAGPGISKQDASKIFEEFYRSDETRLKSVDGLGLGLALAKKLAHEIGADIRLANAGEAGAKFILSIKRTEK